MAVVKKAGWEFDENGAEVFLVVVEYKKPDDLPDWPISAVWKETPVKIVLIDQ